MKPKPPKLFYRRNLPHYQPAGGIFFVTFRLENSIPLVKLQQLKESYYANRLEIENGRYLLKNKLLLAERKRYFKEYDALLDGVKSGPAYLSDPAVAVVTKEQLHRFDGHLYDLAAYCIMANHVHMLIDTGIQLPDDLPPGFEDNTPITPLQNIMKRIKGPSAVEANRLLNRKDRFWRRESFDYLVRNEREYDRIIAYILNNPVKAKMASAWDDFPFSFFKYA
jgi:REP element-mobilizing transposase RayT